MLASIAKRADFASNGAMRTNWRTTVFLCAIAGLSGLSARAQTAAPPPQPKAQAKPPDADANPFPEAESEAAAKEASPNQVPAQGAQPADAPGEPESSSRRQMKGVDLLGNDGSPVSNGAGGLVVDPELAKKDIRIGRLYMADSDYSGAYSRFKEATEVGPGNAEAVFYLAEAARKTSHLDEAAANYKLYLAADPRGKHSKDARKALTELAGK